MSVIPTAKMWVQFTRSAIVQEHQKLLLTCVAGLLAYFILCPIKIDEDGFGDILGGKHRELMRLHGFEV
jgi:hypothetical protein